MPKENLLLPGTVIENRYRIVKLLGQGGFGAVYRAWDTSLNIPCAVKENLEIGTKSQEQFEREARMLAGLSHPNLPRVTDYFFITRQGQYLVMDYIEGQNLQEKIDQVVDPLPVTQVLPWIEQVNEALTYLHSQNPAIIHRDIKPKNIIIRPDGKAFLVDFGIAKLFDPSRETTIGAKAVTPGYSPIEQYGQGKTDERSDVYALGATLYTSLTRMVPPESVIRNTSTPTLNPIALNPSIPAHIDRAVMKAMALYPDYRYQSVKGFHAGLQGGRDYVLPGHVATDRYDEGTSIQKADRAKIPAWGTAGIIFLVIVCCFAAIVLINQARPEIAAFFNPSTSTPTSTIEIITTLPPPSPSFTLPPPVETTPVSTTAPIDTSTPVPPPTDLPTESPTPTPSGSGGLIAFQSNRTGNNDIFMMNNDGSGVTRLTTSPVDDRVPSWSPDGDYIAYQSNTNDGWEIFVVNVATRDIRQITFNDCNDYAPSWSPDGQMFAFYSDCDGNREIYVMGVDGSNRKQLTDTTQTYNWFPTWSPDGSKITFSSNRSGKYQIFVMNANGSGQAALANGCISSYSPDGGLIVFTTYCQDLGDVHLMNADGSNEHVLGDYDWNTNPAFSSDGQRIAFQSNLAGNEDIWVMDLDSSNWTQLTTDPAKDAAPAWQP